MDRAELIDATIDGRFEPIELAGRGGMASVYRARDLRTRTDVALKVASGDEEVLARFEREAQALMGVQHANVASYVAHGRVRGDSVYLAMEWIDGESLAAKLRRGPLVLEEVLALGAQIARALSAVHARGYVHRDVKPANVVLRGNDPTRPVLLDFGLAKPVVGEEITSVGLSVGTPGYMSPEQARGTAKLDSRADLFALGCLLFRSATGQRPFEGPTITAQLAKLLFDAPPSMRALDPRISSSLDALVIRLLTKDPAERPRDASLVASELEELIARRAHSAPRVRAEGALTPDELRPVTVVLVSDTAPIDTPTIVAPIETSEVLLRPVPAPIARDALRRLAESFGGVAESLANGALVVVFHGGTNARDQCVRAARCALKLRPLAAQKAVVLATGRARVAEGEVVGEALDRAIVALQSAEKDGPVRIDEASAQLLDGSFDFTTIPPLALRSEKSDALAQRTLLGQLTPCVGREAELGGALLTWSQCLEESAARVFVVTADAGVGKSRLASEIVRTVASEYPLAKVWLARGDSLTEHAPLALAAKLVRDQAGILGSDSLEVRQSKLRARASNASHPDGVADAVVFLGELCGAPFDDVDLPGLKAARADAPLMSARMRRAFEALLIGDALTTPLLIVIEDLHWADGVSVGWLETGGARVRERPVMMLALSRPEGSKRFANLFSAGSHVHMRPLTAKASAKLARAVLGQEAESATIDRVVELAAGNAFYLEELLRAVAEGHAELPQTVVLMAQARLQALDSDARRVLRAASVFGDAFSQDDVAALSDDDVAASFLPDLVKLEVLAHAPGTADTFTFRHALLREAAYASLTDGDRALGHTLAARWLSAKGGANAMAIADHFARGGAREEAVREYINASSQALQAGDLQAPEIAVTRGLTCDPDPESRGKLLGLLARALWQRGDMAKAEQVAMEVMTLVPPASIPWYDALADLMNARQGRLDHGGIDALAVELLASPPHDGAVLASYARALSLAYTLVIQNSPASELARALTARVEVVAASSEAQDPVIGVRFAIARAFAALTQRRPGAEGLLESCARTFEELGNVMAAEMQRTGQAIALAWLGAWEESIAVLSAIPKSSSRPSRWARLYLAWPLALTGRWDEGFASASWVLEQEHDDPFLITETRIALGRLLLLRKRLGDALDVVKPQIADESLPRPMRGRLHAIAYEATLSADPEVAAQHAKVVEACLHDRVPFVEDAIYVRQIVIEHLLATHDIDGARALVLEASKMIADYAARIESPRRLTSYLERVPENVRIRELAALLS